MIIDDEDYSRISEWALRFERSTFTELKKMITSIPKDSLEELEFYNWLYDRNIFSEISAHKIKLARFLAQAARVTALPEDRTRIVFTLADLANEEIVNVNKMLVKEFGPYFKLLSNYNAGGRVIGWREILKRAAEIKNGLYNHDRMQVENIAQEATGLFKMTKIVDQETLGKIVDISQEIIAVGSMKAFSTLGDPALKNVRELVAELYRLTGRTKFEVEHLEEETDMAKIRHLAYYLKYVSMAKLYFLTNNLPLDNTEAAYDYFSNRFAVNFSRTYISAEEFARAGKPLQPLTSTLTTTK